MPQSTTIRNQDGWLFRIGPGEIAGVCDVSFFSDPERGVSKSDGIISLSLGFVSSSDEPFVLGNFIPIATVFPTDSTPLSRGNELLRFGQTTTFADRPIDAGVRSLIDFLTLRSFPVRVGFDGFTFVVRAAEHSMEAQLVFHPMERRHRREDEYVLVNYEVPYEELCWRPARVIAASRAYDSDADYLRIRPTGLAPSAYKKPTNIEVIERSAAPVVTIAEEMRQRFLQARAAQGLPPLPPPQSPPPGIRILDKLALATAASDKAVRGSLRWQITTAGEYACTDGGRFRVEPGVGEGRVQIEPATQPPFADRDFTTMVFVLDFIDAAGMGRRYSCLLTPYAFWPQPSDVLRKRTDLPTSLWTFECLGDTRDNFELRFSDGSVENGRMKYTPFAGSIRVGPSALTIAIKVHRNWGADAGDDMYFEYDAYPERFLWRNSILMHPDGDDTVDADYVDVIELPASSFSVSRSSIHFD